MTSELKSIKEVQAVVEANSSFSASLQQCLKKTHPDNLIFSPLSVSTVVAIAKLGARGKTGDEIAKGFNFPPNDETLGKGYSQVLPTLNSKSNDGYTFCQANKLYCKTGFELNKEYAGAVKKYFSAEIEQIDFAKNDAAAKTINGWVESITTNKIKNLIAPGSLNTMTAIVLVNGVYFKGLWKDKFDPKNTEKAKFYLNEKDTKEVDMMFKSAKFPYIELSSLDSCAVSLPYKGDRLCMIIYLPNKNSGLSKLEEGLKNLTPSKVLGKMKISDLVELSLPRFKIESTLQLVEPLKKLGLQSMFANNADFSGIPKSSTSLFVSDVVQKAFIEVNEEGSEAAAATGMTIMMMSMPRTITFTADHPFLFQIVDGFTNCILFAGCVKKPQWL